MRKTDTLFVIFWPDWQAIVTERIVEGPNSHVYIARSPL